MSEPSRRAVHDRWRRLAIVLVTLAFAGSVVALFMTASEALEERRVAVAATDVRLAVLSIAPVSDIGDLDPAARELFDNSLARLSGPLDEALHAIPPADRPDVRGELEELVQHAEEMIAGRDHHLDHSLSAHTSLQETFRQASIDASADATASERRAELAAIVSVALFAVMVGSLLRSRYRAKSVAAQANAYQDAAQRFGTLLDHSPDATAVVGTDGTVSYASASLVELLGSLPTTSDEIAVLAAPDERASVLSHLQRAGADWADLEVTSPSSSGDEVREYTVSVADLSNDPVVNGFLVSISETTSENRARRRLEHLANHDQLTGLPNRRRLMADLEVMTSSALLLLDLDGFKETNDTHGHGAGDVLLSEVAVRLTGVLDDRDHLYRLGGDEFAVLTDRTIAGAEFVADRMLTALDEPIELLSGMERTGASIGIAHTARPSSLSLLRRADIALYEAKRRGGRLAVTSSSELDDRSVLRTELGRAFDAADFDAEFHLEFQPIVDEHGRTRSVEALARWTSPVHGPVRPDVFIPIAENSGRIGEFGHWVLDRALHTLSTWRTIGVAGDIGINVNVSPYQLEDDRFVERTRSLLNRHGIDPGSLVIELTESALATAIEPLADQLRALSDLGCVIACDDFGSGYSNLAQLMTLPLDVIKLDRSLLLRLSEMRAMTGGSNEQPCQVMSAIVSIGAAMQATIVAEGVETDVQARSIVSAGVQLQQGYLYSRPLTQSDMGRMLARCDDDVEISR